MPPAHYSKPHIHAHTDIIVVVLDGYAATLTGPELEPTFHGPGEFMFVPEGVLHVAVNLSREHSLTAIEVRTDPNYNDDVVLAEEYFSKASDRARELQEQFTAQQEFELNLENVIDRD